MDGTAPPTWPPVVRLDAAGGLPVPELGGKAATLATLAAEGFPVPNGLVVTNTAWSLPRAALAARITSALEATWPRGDMRFAVRSSAVAEDLPDASYAGQYETLLNVPLDGVADATVACHDAASSTRVAAYRSVRTLGPPAATPGGFAVLIQPMVSAEAAGVAFTADPLTGARDEVVVTAVPGLGEQLVGGNTTGDSWTVRAGTATPRRQAEHAITPQEALAVADLALRVQALQGPPQDIEWALEPAAADDPGSPRRVVLLQARPMTALPDPVDWPAPGPGLWWHNFRLGEWLPEPLTPLFADWLLPAIEDGYLDGMRSTAGAVVPFRYTTVNGWYYNAVPRPSLGMLLSILTHSRGRIVPVLFNALVRVSHNPAAADRALLGRLHHQWRDVELPAYRRLVESYGAAAASSSSATAAEAVDRLGHAAGRQLWFLAIVGGSAWKMEDRLASLVRRHLPDLTAEDGVLADGPQVLLRGLPGAEHQPQVHDVLSADWFWPTGSTAAPRAGNLVSEAAQRHGRLVAQREQAEAACLAGLDPHPRARREFVETLEVTRRYTVIREDQARTFTLAWPLLRSCALRLGADLAVAGHLGQADDVFFLRRSELDEPTNHRAVVAARQAGWQRQRQLQAPLALGTPPRIVGDPIARAVARARGDEPVPPGAMRGEPASAGRATGRVRVLTDPEQLPSFQPGEILVARATSPAWTPLFALAAAVVTDSGTLAAHASIVAREYGIPAVVATGDATTRLTTGTLVTVDGTRGLVTPH